jgi:hypothetical protein
MGVRGGVLLTMNYPVLHWYIFYWFCSLTSIGKHVLCIHSPRIFWSWKSNSKNHSLIEDWGIWAGFWSQMPCTSKQDIRFLKSTLLHCPFHIGGNFFFFTPINWSLISNCGDQLCNHKKGPKYGCSVGSSNIVGWLRVIQFYLLLIFYGSTDLWKCL